MSWRTFPQHRKLEVAEAFPSMLSQSTADEACARAVTIIEQYGKTLPAKLAR